MRSFLAEITDLPAGPMLGPGESLDDGRAKLACEIFEDLTISATCNARPHRRQRGATTVAVITALPGARQTAPFDLARLTRREPQHETAALSKSFAQPANGPKHDRRSQ